MKRILNFLSKIIIGNADYNNVKCDKCESTDLKQVNESIDGLYVEFECGTCKNHITI
jgi:hypothetical protein